MIEKKQIPGTGFMNVTGRARRNFREENSLNKTTAGPAIGKEATLYNDGVFEELDTAIEAAYEAQKQLISMSLSKRKEIIFAIRQHIKNNAEVLAAATVKETGLGRFEDKIKKIILAAEKTPGVEILEPEAYTGDNGLCLSERAPFGVIASIAPVTNPAATIVNNGIGMLAAGNTVVFNAHPSAKGITNQTIGIINNVIKQAGGPQNLLTSIKEPTVSSAQQLMKHPLIKLVVVTGGAAVVRVAMTTGKKVIAAGPGNPPVIIDETAELEKAAANVVSGASFDNNIICICEKELIVVNSVFDTIKAYLKKYGAFEANKWQVKKLENILLAENKGPGKAGLPNKSYVGKNASYILNDLGIEAPDSTKLVVMEVEPDHPFVWSELMMPVLPIVRVRNVDEAIELAVKAERGCGHSVVMHSRNIEKLSEMGKRANTAIFTKNGPSYAGLGFGGQGYTSFTIATTTGEGLTNSRHFTRGRMCVLVDYFRIV